MKYQRLKSIDGSGTIQRYFELAAGQKGLCNCFYGVKDNKATKIVGSVGEDVELIGFAHGGDNLAKGLLFLDINPAVVYMGILEEADVGRPNIGEVVNGYQKVIDIHYDGDAGVSGKGTKPEEWGIERMTNPYYLFTIVQPEGTAAEAIDDSGAGEESGGGFDPEPVWNFSVVFESNGGSEVAPQGVEPGGLVVEPQDPTKDGYTFAGWYSDETLTTEYDFSTPVTSDLTLYADWDEA